MKQIYAFAEGNMEMQALLGGKGANLAEMTNLGLPVPQGLRSQPLRATIINSITGFQKRC